MAQVGQGAIVVATIAAVTVMVVAGRMDASVAVGVILGVVGIGSGVSVSAHATEAVATVQAPTTGDQEKTHATG